MSSTREERLQQAPDEWLGHDWAEMAGVALLSVGME